MSDFFTRWSARARAARLPAREDPASLDPPVPSPADDVEDPAAAESPDLPDVAELGAESDYRPFLQRTVAPALRRLALRRLWQSDPVLANLDGLNDYDEDFAALHRRGAETIAAAVRAGRRYARDPAAPSDADPAAAEPAPTTAVTARDGTDTEGTEAEGTEVEDPARDREAGEEPA